MACAKEWGLLLSKYVDAEASTEERQLVESHLTSCKDCVGTWDLFRRNEKILESALAGEAFGDLVVDDVMAEIRRLETPAVVAPAVESSARWEKVRRWLPTAAAAAMMVATLGIVLASRPDVSDRQQAEMEREIADAKIEDLMREVVRQRLQGQPPGSAIVTPDKSLEIKGQFRDASNFTSIDLERRTEGTVWAVIGTGLSEPHYVDRRVEPGVWYLYRFSGHAKDGSKVKSAEIPAHIQVPGGLDPQTSLNVKLLGVTNDLAMAMFEIERYVDGTRSRYKFRVRPNEPIGEIVDGVDYRTNLYVDRIETGDQIDQAWGSRINKKVRLRAVNSPPTDKSVDLWKDSSQLFPLPQ